MTIGITGYGAYLPILRIKGAEIAKTLFADWNKIYASLGVIEKTVPGHDEDSATMAVAAGLNLIRRARILPSLVDALFIGSESHPYAVKPTATIVLQALALNPCSYSSSIEFACKGGTAALISSFSMVKSGLASNALAIGTDTAQAAPGDILEYTAAAGAAAILVGSRNVVATIDHCCSLTTNTPDFWRRAQSPYPKHTGRFSSEPAYFYHVQAVTEKLMKEYSITPDRIDHVVFHQPNLRFAQVVAKRLGFSEKQLYHGLLVETVGNTYSAASLLGLTAVLDNAKPDQRILVVSYGSGSGADAILLTTTKNLMDSQLVNTPKTSYYVNNKSYVKYQQYRGLN